MHVVYSNEVRTKPFSILPAFTCCAVLFLLTAAQSRGQDVALKSLVPSKPIGPGEIIHLTYSPDSRRLAVLTTAGELIRDPALPPYRMVAVPHSHYLMYSDGQRLLVWHRERNQAVPIDEIPMNRLTDTLACSPDAKQLAYLFEQPSGESEIRVLDIATGHLAERWKTARFAQITALAWTGKLTAVESLGGAIRFWRVP